MLPVCLMGGTGAGHYDGSDDLEPGHKVTGMHPTGHPVSLSLGLSDGDQESVRSCLQRLGDPGQHHDCDVSFPPLHLRDVCPIQISLEGELFLRHAQGLTGSPDRVRQHSDDCPIVHPNRWSTGLTFGPRTMSLISSGIL